MEEVLIREGKDFLEKRREAGEEVNMKKSPSRTSTKAPALFVFFFVSACAELEAGEIPSDSMPVAFPQQRFS